MQTLSNSANSRQLAKLGTFEKNSNSTRADSPQHRPKSSLNSHSLLNQQDWPGIRRSLCEYAHWQLQNFWFRFGDSTSPEDLAHEAIASLWDGTRKWDPSRVNIQCFLRGVIDSKISHLFSSVEQTRLVSIHTLHNIKNDEDPYERDGIDLHIFNEIQNDTPLFTSGLLDSMAFIEAVIFMESEFKIRLADAVEVNADNMDSLGQWTQAVLKACAKKRT